MSLFRFKFGLSCSGTVTGILVDVIIALQIYWCSVVLPNWAVWNFGGFSQLAGSRVRPFQWLFIVAQTAAAPKRAVSAARGKTRESLIQGPDHHWMKKKQSETDGEFQDRQS